MPNLLRHVKNITKHYNLPAVVAINKFPTDTEDEIAFVKKRCLDLKVDVVLSDVWANGGKGGIELANKVVSLCENPAELNNTFKPEMGIKDKINAKNW